MVFFLILHLPDLLYSALKVAKLIAHNQEFMFLTFFL